MKTAISIPDNVFSQADKLASRLNMSRSALYTAAVEDYIARRSAEEITTRLDTVYGTLEQRSAALPTAERPPVSRADHW